jgi:transcriptional regulator with XRE-family HTH domain
MRRLGRRTQIPAVPTTGWVSHGTPAAVILEDVNSAGDLGDFLRTRRARLRPADVDLRSYGDRRRVPGLRREELAQMAGVSVSYYTRLEQGQSRHASAEVLEALARALRLDPHERGYLLDIGRAGQPGARGEESGGHARPGVLRLLEAMTDVPAIVLSPATDVLAWNALGHALFGVGDERDSVRSPRRRPNMARKVFLDPAGREFYVDWHAKACSSVSHLRLVAGQFPEDRRLRELIGELTVSSPEFAALWSAHSVRTCEPVARAMRHPWVGPLTLLQETMWLREDGDQLLVTQTAEPGSPSADALRLLGSLSQRPAEPANRRHDAGRRDGAPPAPPAPPVPPAPRASWGDSEIRQDGDHDIPAAHPHPPA